MSKNCVKHQSKDWFRVLVANGVMLISDLDVKRTCRVQRSASPGFQKPTTSAQARLGILNGYINEIDSRPDHPQDIVFMASYFQHAS